jgi:hypothetical protein
MYLSQCVQLRKHNDFIKILYYLILYDKINAELLIKWLSYIANTHNLYGPTVSSE